MLVKKFQKLASVATVIEPHRPANLHTDEEWFFGSRQELVQDVVLGPLDIHVQQVNVPDVV